MMPNRMERIMAFLDLEKYRDGLGLQQWRSLLAFGFLRREPARVESPIPTAAESA